jgi:hypothetical protein
VQLNGVIFQKIMLFKITYLSRFLSDRGALVPEQIVESLVWDILQCPLRGGGRG